MDIAATVQPKVCPKLCSAEQCAFMCFMGLTADSDEGIDDAACHFVVWFLGGGKIIIQISSNTPLFL